MKSVREASVKGKRVLVRCDLDVPIEGGRVVDDMRLLACLPTLQLLVERGAKVIIGGHLGRPEGTVVEELRLDPIAAVLSKHLGAVHKADEVVGPTVVEVVDEMADGDLLLLENLRFDPGEEADDPQFAAKLAALADLYVNEAFAVCHRAVASVVGVSKLLPAYAGLRLMEEVEKLTAIRNKPTRPLVFIMGGAKAETKVPLVWAIAKYADQILLGGTLMLERSLEGIKNVAFPVDAVEAYDIGPKTIKKYQAILAEAKTIVWNGPVGKFEAKKFSAGTKALAEYLAVAEAMTIVGGGDTLAALRRFGVLEKMTFISVGGGAMLALLAGEELPGIVALG